MSQPSRPRLTLLKIPEEERKHAKFVQRNLESLDDCVAYFKAAMHLVDQTGPLLQSTDPIIRNECARYWLKMAYRSALVHVFTFSQACEALLKSVRQCPSLNSHMDVPIIEQVIALFNELFPNVQEARLGAAHGMELGRNEKEMTKHSLNIPADGDSLDFLRLFATDNIVGDTYVCTVRGKIVQAKVNWEAMRNLEMIAAQMWLPFFGAFDAISNSE